jgi:hypothetical protein
MMKTKLIPWLAPLVMLLCAAGCPVDVNEGEGGDDDGPSTAECPPAELATVRFFHAAGGTPVVRLPFVAASTPSLNIVRTDLDPEDPPIIASLAPGRAATVQICGNKPVVLGARLASASADRVALPITLTPDADSTLFDVGLTIVLAGISDDGDNPASAANPLRFIEVPDTFGTAAETQIQVVHASRKTPATVDVEVNPDSPGVEIMALARYGFSGIVQTRGTTDVAPATVPVAFLEGTASRASFTISPRLPTGAKVLAILFDTEVYDPANPDPTKINPAPTAKLFVTGDDPLLGRVAGGGVTF